jgi:hypothetical protein
MKKSWDTYEKQYDELNGEGSYSELHRLPLVYGDEYDSETDTDIDNDNDSECYIFNENDYDD